MMTVLLQAKPGGAIDTVRQHHCSWAQHGQKHRTENCARYPLDAAEANKWLDKSDPKLFGVEAAQIAMVEAGEDKCHGRYMLDKGKQISPHMLRGSPWKFL
jgi:hypothetical protein